MIRILMHLINGNWVVKNIPLGLNAFIKKNSPENEYQKYTTHTSLSYSESAFSTFTKSQVIWIGVIIIIFIESLLLLPLNTIRLFISLLSVLYFADTFFNLYLVLKSLNKPVEISFDDNYLQSLKSNLPIYTILCPLYKEARIIPQFLKSISRLDWPRDRLDVMLLLEEDDYETINSVSRMRLPRYVRVITVPDSKPKTKPKACNYGLKHALGEFLVIFDAEDMPDPLQLKKAYWGFKTLPKNVRCLQAKLNYYNPDQNLLTRLFTIEYSLWFNLTLTGLQSVNSVIPLGGTSNHFRIRDLKELGGWDPFNVTEDADLGIRLFQKGYKTAIIDSITLEEANSDVFNWVRQRSRWIKGYMQTYLVHSRQFFKFARQNGLKHALIFQLTIGGKILFIFMNPFMWLITFLYFAFPEYTSNIIETVFYPPVSYLAVFSWIFGNFLFLYYYMIACGKQNQWTFVKFVFLIPFYWALMSYAGTIALYQLLIKPHYWEKTVHGLHLKRTQATIALRKSEEIIIFARQKTNPSQSYLQILDKKIKNYTRLSNINYYRKNLNKAYAKSADTDI